MTDTATQQRFHAAATDADGCDCPIHRRRDRPPFTAPLGLPFADAVDVESITRDQAEAIYDAHHGYMDGVPSVNLAHHALRYQDQTVGAITYRYPLLRCKRLHLDADGRPIPEPRSREAIRNELPERLHATALDTLELHRVDEADVEETRVVDGDRFVEAARICLGVRMANLASAALACSQERFAAGPHCEDGVAYLLTFVRSDYDGAMVRALRDKGWTCVGWTRPSQAGNREDRPIREHRKWTFVCPVDRVREQSELGRWSE